MDETKKTDLKFYESPETKKIQVELEGNLCGSATVRNPDTNSGRIEEHSKNADFSGDFSGSEWDSKPQ